MINLDPNKNGLYDTRSVQNLTLHQMCCSEPMWTQRKIESQAKEIEGLREKLNDAETLIVSLCGVEMRWEASKRVSQYLIKHSLIENPTEGKFIRKINDIEVSETGQATKPADTDKGGCYCDGLELEGLAVCKECGRTSLTPPPTNKEEL